MKIDAKTLTMILIYQDDDADSASKQPSIAITINTPAHSMGLSVIAKGVETLAQRDFLANHGGLACQGEFQPSAAGASV